MNDSAGPVLIVPIDDPNAPVIFADQVVGAGPMGANTGVTNITFAIQLWDHSETPPRPYLRTCLRLIMPTASLLQALDFTTQTIGQSSTDRDVRPTVRLN